MAISPVLRQIMADRTSLRQYADGLIHEDDRVYFRRLKLFERELDRSLPDHFYNSSQEYKFGEEITDLVSAMSIGLARLAADHLELRGNLIGVKFEAVSDWQEVLTFCTPTPLLAAFLWDRVFLKGMLDTESLRRFIKDYIAPNVRHTSLPGPQYPYLVDLAKKGFHDLHIHLNGSTETDIAWHYYFRTPHKILEELEKGLADSDKVKELWEQEAPGESPIYFFKLIRSAIRVRKFMVAKVFGIEEISPEFTGELQHRSLSEIFRNDSRAQERFYDSADHPLASVLKANPLDDPGDTDECLEAMMYVLIIDSLITTRDGELASAFHYYLLILGFANRFLVQQTYQKGFDQFQKITQTKFRETPEKTYARRFFQLGGNKSGNIKIIEGRMSPQRSVTENLKQFKNVTDGFKEYKKSCKINPKLLLVWHFIKNKDKEKLTDTMQFNIRHRNERIKLSNLARHVVNFNREYQKAAGYISGVDAASNELEAPPEVFAPTFRYLRQSGINHFTYHAGEDFHHLLGGMRAMYEAVEFLGLRNGDRIGHGTASGIDPEIWLKHVRNKLHISQGEWLDDLIFVYHFLSLESVKDRGSLYLRLPAITREIEKLAHNIYGKSYTCHALAEAWLLRKYCPYHMLQAINGTRENVNINVWNSGNEWEDCRAVVERIGNANGNNELSDIFDLVEKHHIMKYRKLYEKVIHIQKPDDVLDVQELKAFQRIFIGELHRREIVLETLPTSNVRISFYKDMAEHHLWRWLKLKSKDGRRDHSMDFDSVPPIVVGTDDTGIFATNIFNEYGHIYHTLLTEFGYGQQEAAEVIDRLERNSGIYAFKPKTRAAGEGKGR